MLSKVYKIIISAVVIALPIQSYAQEYLKKTDGILDSLYGIVADILVPMAFIAALLFFFWGVAKYIRSEGSGKDEGKKIMVWGVIALFVMSSVWGLVYFIRSELQVGDDARVTIPTIRTSGGGIFNTEGPNEGSGEGD